VEKFKMKKSLLVVALLSAFAPMLAHAEAGDIVVRLRATNVNPNVDSKLASQTTASYNAGTTDTFYKSTTAALTVDANTIPELDISYYITKNIAAELILAVGTRHDVNISGMGAGAAITDAKLGSVNLLPPTLTGQWHFNPDQMIDPYVGGGAAFVLGLDRKLTATTAAGGLPIRIDRSAFGAVLQAGFDVNLQDKWLINFDVKKIWVNTDVKLDAGTGYKKIDNLDLNPLVLSVGIGKRF
jgi:outer membrane protein